MFYVCYTQLRYIKLKHDKICRRRSDGYYKYLHNTQIKLPILLLSIYENLPKDVRCLDWKDSLKIYASVSQSLWYSNYLNAQVR